MAFQRSLPARDAPRRAIRGRVRRALLALESDLPTDPPRDLHLGSLTRDDGTVLAYYKTAAGKASGAAGAQQPGVVFLGGFMSDMSGTKAVALEDWARRRGRAFLRFDYRGHGASSGRFEDGTIGDWAGDAVAALDALTEGPQILVGSSMGGWIMLLAALARPQRVAALVGIAAAPDFTDWGYDAAQKAELAAGRALFEDNPYGPEPTPTYPEFWADGQALRQLEGEIPLDCPVRLLHGQDDGEVPPEVSLRLAERLRSSDVQVTLVKGGDHRLSRERDIALLLRTVAAL